MALKGDGTTRQAKGSIRVFSDSRVEVRFTYTHPVVHSDDPPLIGELSGTTTTGLKLLPTKASYLRAEFPTRRTTNLVYRPIRCVLSVPSPRAVTLARFYLKNLRLYAGTASVSHGGVTGRLLPHGTFEPMQFGGMLEVSGRRLSREKADDFAEDVSRLIAVALRCPCVPCFREYCAGTEVQRIEFFENSWDHRPVRVLIPPVGTDFEHFLAQALPRLRTTQATMNTSLLIDYYWRAHQETTVELKFLLTSVFMEAVKFHYARNLSGHQQDLKASGVIRQFLRPNGRPWGFEDLLKQTAHHFGVARIDRRTGFIENRNCIFHSGQTSFVQLGQRSTYRPLKTELWKLFDLMDDFLLKILGYRGRFFGFRDMERLILFPSRRRAPRPKGLAVVPAGVSIPM